MIRTKSWQCSNKQYAYCAKCDKLMRKLDMNAIKVGNYNPKILCFLCEDCFISLLDELGINFERDE